MSPLAILALLAAAAAGLLWVMRRRAAARRAQCREELMALLAERRPQLALVDSEAGRWQLHRAADVLATLDPGRLTRAASGTAERRRRLPRSRCSEAWCA